MRRRDIMLTASMSPCSVAYELFSIVNKSAWMLKPAPRHFLDLKQTAADCGIVPGNQWELKWGTGVKRAAARGDLADVPHDPACRWQ